MGRDMDQGVKRETILAFVRHALTFAGGTLLAQGVASEDQVSDLVGALITIVGVVWSIWEKRSRSATGGGSGTTAMLLVVCSGMVGLAQTGCGTTGLYKAAAAAESTVDAAMRGWAEYVVAAEKDPEVSRAELLKSEGKIKTVYDAYRNAMNAFYSVRAAWAAGKAGSGGSGVTDAALDGALEDARAAARSVTEAIAAAMGKDTRK